MNQWLWHRVRTLSCDMFHFWCPKLQKVIGFLWTRQFQAVFEWYHISFKPNNTMLMYIFAYLAGNPPSPLAAFVEFQIVPLSQLTLYQTSSNKQPFWNKSCSICVCITLHQTRPYKGLKTFGSKLNNSSGNICGWVMNWYDQVSEPLGTKPSWSL